MDLIRALVIRSYIRIFKILVLCYKFIMLQLIDIMWFVKLYIYVFKKYFQYMFNYY